MSFRLVPMLDHSFFEYRTKRAVAASGRRRPERPVRPASSDSGPARSPSRSTPAITASLAEEREDLWPPLLLCVLGARHSKGVPNPNLSICLGARAYAKLPVPEWPHTDQTNACRSPRCQAAQPRALRSRNCSAEPESRQPVLKGKPRIGDRHVKEGSATGPTRRPDQQRARRSE